MIVGIDLGTTNSLVGIWRDQHPVLIPNALGSFLTPSVVGEADDGSILVGQAARDRLVTHPGQTASVFKRYMGTERQISVGKSRYRAEELSAIVLRSLKADAEAFLYEPVTEAVITVPAYFNDAQRKATKLAGHLAGLKVERLLTEPTAAALAYGFSGEGAESTILVIDLGGGTLDVSLLHSFEGIMEVKATAGDIWLGGEDFTDGIASALLSEKKLKIADLSVLGSLRRQAELAKRTLSSAEAAQLSFLLDGHPVAWSISREQFEQISEPLMARMRAPLERALRDARIAPDEITRIIFAGGGTRMPMVKRLVTRLFRQMPLTHIDPDEVVARGVAVRVGLIERGAGLEENVLTDVAPFTLGVEISQRTQDGGLLTGMFLPIIERNSVVPCSRSHILQTLENNQTGLKLGIYQGESRLVQDNVFLGEIETSVPKARAGEEKIDVRFTYDASGLLEVDVKVLSTGLGGSLVLEGNPGTMSKTEIQQRLAKLANLKIHPREQAANASLLARATRMFEESLGDVRKAIGERTNQFAAALESQRLEEIEIARSMLTTFLDSIDTPIRF